MTQQVTHSTICLKIYKLIGECVICITTANRNRPDESTHTELPEQLLLMQQLKQQVPKRLLFSKDCIQLGRTVGQGTVDSERHYT